MLLIQQTIEILLPSINKPEPTSRSSRSKQKKIDTLQLAPGLSDIQSHLGLERNNIDLGKLLDDYLKIAKSLKIKIPEIKMEEPKTDVQTVKTINIPDPGCGQLANQEGIVDPTTRDLFRSYIRGRQMDGPVNKGIRDALIANLAICNGVSSEELADMFRLNKRKIKEITKLLGGALPHKSPNSQEILQNQICTARIKSLIRAKIASKNGLITSSSLIAEIKCELGYDISKYQITRQLKYSLGLQWKNVLSQDDYEKNIGLRKDFADQIVAIIQEPKIILNFDESQIDASNWRRMSLVTPTGPRARKWKRSFTGLSILLAVSKLGDIYFKFHKGPNNECIVAQFFIDLERQLSHQLPNWRNTHVLLLDNYPSHKTMLVRQVLGALGYQVMFSAPASYLIIPVEGIFGALKATNFAVMEEPTLPGKREIHITKLTHMQKCVLLIANYLFSISIDSIKHIFRRALSSYQDFSGWKRFEIC